MKTFVINLKRSPERRSRMERLLAKHNIEFEFFEGVDGSKLSEQELNKFIDPSNQYHRSFMPTEVGCFLSHYHIFRKIVDHNLPYALILEDDIDVSPRLPKLLKEIEVSIKQGDVIHLYSSFPEPCKLVKENNIDENYFYARPLYNELVVGNVAYIITREVAKNMVENIFPIYGVIDDWRMWEQRKYVNNFKIVFPQPVDLSDMYSDIHESKGGIGLRIKKFIVHNEIPFLSCLILNRRKRGRWLDRMNKITIDNRNISSVFY